MVTPGSTFFISLITTAHNIISWTFLGEDISHKKMYASVATSVMVMMLLMMNTSVNRRRKDVLCHSFDVFDEKVGSFDSDYPSDFFNDEYSTPICECSRRLGKFKDRACRKEVRQHSTDKLREIIGILLEEISANGATGSVAENIGKLLKPTSGGLSAM